MSGWDKYLSNRTKINHFEKQGVPEWYVKMRGADTIPFGEALLLQREVDQKGEDVEVGSRAGFRMLARLIVEWNIEHPQKPVNEDGTPNILPLPSEDIEVLNLLPSEIIMQLSEWANEGISQESVIPPTNAPASGQQ